MMDHHPRRRRADTATARTRNSILERPDRLVLWAFVIGIVGMVFAATTSADGSSGGLATAEQQTKPRSSECVNARFGKRNLRRPDCGADVQTLNWILRSKPFQRNVRLNQRFHSRTQATVRTFQQRRDLRPNGVVNKRTRQQLIRSMPRQRATWYGPGFWGNRTACGQRLRKSTEGVAHRSLPCGTRVTVGYRGRFVRTRVIDRGPYAHGARWDLTRRVAQRVGMIRQGVANVRVAPIRRGR